MPNKQILANLANNPELLKAVKEVFLERFSIDGLTANASDELLGQAVRARLVGIKAVEDACREIESYKTAPQATEKDNPAY